MGNNWRTLPPLRDMTFEGVLDRYRVAVLNDQAPGGTRATNDAMNAARDELRARLTVLEQENAGLTLEVTTLRALADALRANAEEMRHQLRGPEDARPLSIDPDSSPDWCGCCDAWTCPIHRPSETTAP